MKKIFEIQKWMTTKEAANYLRMTENAFRIYASRYKLDAYTLGEKSVRYKTSDLDRLMTLKTRSHK